MITTFACGVRRRRRRPRAARPGRRGSRGVADELDPAQRREARQPAGPPFGAAAEVDLDRPEGVVRRALPGVVVGHGAIVVPVHPRCPAATVARAADTPRGYPGDRARPPLNAQRSISRLAGRSGAGDPLRRSLGEPLAVPRAFEPLFGTHGVQREPRNRRMARVAFSGVQRRRSRTLAGLELVRPRRRQTRRPHRTRAMRPTSIPPAGRGVAARPAPRLGRPARRRRRRAPRGPAGP